MTQSTIQTIQVKYNEESCEMMEMWPNVVSIIMEIVENFNITDVTKWLKKVNYY